MIAWLLFVIYLNFLQVPKILEKRPQFGTRYLKEGDDVYSYNAWDNVEWDENQQKAAEEIICQHLASKMSLADYEKIEENADQYWNEFYSIHSDKFYKDRHWLFTEFPELSFDTSNIDVKSTPILEENVILEVGCGVGNTIFPILQHNQNANIRIYGCDFSATAIEIFKNNEAYDPNKCTAFVYDITSEEELPVAENSVHVILMIYVLSSVHPEKMKFVIQKLHRYLKPGGLILFRDYGRYDLSQLRFKKGRCITDNFYARGEGTLVYFFDTEEISQMFSSCGYDVKQIICDKRLQVNRRKQLKMYRVWIQGKFMKPI